MEMCIAAATISILVLIVLFVIGCLKINNDIDETFNYSYPSHEDEKEKGDDEQHY